MAIVTNTLNRGGGGGTSITVVANYSALPDPTTVSGEFYWAEASQGTSWLPGSLGGTYYNSGMYYSNGVSWTFMNVPYQATQAEVNTGTNDDKFVTPKTLRDGLDATPTDGSSKAVSSNGVFDALALKANKARTIFQGKTSITGVTSYTTIFTMKVDGGLYSATDGFSFVMDLYKTATASNVSYRVFIGTTAGAKTTQIGLLTLLTGNLGCGFLRNYSLMSGNIESNIGGATASAFPYQINSNAGLSTALNPANDWWITVEANPSVGSEIVGVNLASITPLK